MLVMDFFAGTLSSTQAFADAGHRVISFELDESFEATEHIDVMNLIASKILVKYGRPDFIWASPPCTSFSVASIGHHWINGGSHPVPRTPEAEKSQLLVQHTINLIAELNPTYGWLIENPMGMLRKLPVVSKLRRTSVTYCQYGDSRMKPTDLWGEVVNWSPREMCKRGSPCHEAAPRGSRTGTQGIVGSKNRSRVPYELSLELLDAITNKGG